MRTLCWKAAALGAGLLLNGALARAAGTALVTAVSAETGSGYTRQKLPDGSFRREYYALANGGYSPGRDKNRSIDGVQFPDLAGMVAQVLARRNYYFAPDAKAATLLVVIRWGTTIPFRSAQYANAATDLLGSMNAFKDADREAQEEAASKGGPREANGTLREKGMVRAQKLGDMQDSMFLMLHFEGARRDADAENARLLGYMKEINYRDNLSREAGAGLAYDDLISDVETERYYVIISAYDFHAATQLKQNKLLWVTRVSIQVQGNRFNERLKDMLAAASRYLGEDSGRLVRQYQQGTTSFGDLKLLGYEPEPPPPPAPKPEEKH